MRITICVLLRGYARTVLRGEFLCNKDYNILLLVMLRKYASKA